MTQSSAAAGDHPKTYLRPMPIFWWLKRWRDLKFMLRELSSVFVAWFVVVLLLLMRALGQGSAAYQQYLEWLQSPGILALNVVTFGFVLFHAISWFNLAPRAMVVRVGGKRVPELVIAASNYAGWVVASAAVAWLLVGG